MDKACEIHQRECNSQYLEILEDLASSTQEKIQFYKDSVINYETTIKQLESKIKDQEAIMSAAVAVNIRAAEMDNKQDFYRLNLSSEDISEIKRLREVTPYLRNSEPLNKVIWKTYYEKAYTDLIGRVVGSGIHTGIYKITNIENKMCYVGQSVDIAERWKQHIKRGIGAEAPTRNKLYPAMLAIGVENFTFEIIEECDRSLLNEREQYWQNCLKAKEYGYSIK